MGVRILDSEGASTERGAVLFDSVSGMAFGPIWDDHDEAEHFLGWLRERIDTDPRDMSEREVESFVREFKDAS